MTTTRLSTKGQLIIPKELRERLGWTPGTELELEDRGDAVVVRSVASVPRSSLDEVLGCLRYAGRPRTLEEMAAAIVTGARASNGSEDR